MRAVRLGLVRRRESGKNPGVIMTRSTSLGLNKTTTAIVTPQMAQSMKDSRLSRTSTIITSLEFKRSAKSQIDD